MRSISYDDVREFLHAYLSRKLESQGRTLPNEFSDDSDLLLSGLIDSLGMLDLVTALEEFCGREVDFESLDPEKLTIVRPLCEFVSAYCATSSHSD